MAQVLHSGLYNDDEEETIPVLQHLQHHDDIVGAPRLLLVFQIAHKDDFLAHPLLLCQDRAAGELQEQCNNL
jgi:hypothetical protein